MRGEGNPNCAAQTAASSNPVRRALATIVTGLLIAGAAGCGDSDKDKSTSGGATGTVPHAFALLDSWHGQLKQKKLEPFEVTARIRSLSTAKLNTVHYTGINCSGNWTYLGRAHGAFRFREVINSGESAKCKGVGIVRLTPKGDNQLDYVFRGGGVESRGVLSRG